MDFTQLDLFHSKWLRIYCGKQHLHKKRLPNCRISPSQLTVHSLYFSKQIDYVRYRKRKQKTQGSPLFLTFHPSTWESGRRIFRGWEVQTDAFIPHVRGGRGALERVPLVCLGERIYVSKVSCFEKLCFKEPVINLSSVLQGCFSNSKRYFFES